MELKRGRKTSLYHKISKLLNSDNDGDNILGKEILLGSIETMHPDEWTGLNGTAWYSYIYSANETQKYLYDKRQSEQELLRKDKKTTRE